MERDYHSRFKDCPWYSDKFPSATIGGVGGIGSWLSFFLGRIGLSLNLYDDDFVDFTNMGGQLYPVAAIGRSKADTVKQLVQEFSGNSKVTSLGRYERGCPVDNIVFTCFDNMHARRAMFEEWRRKNPMERATNPAVFIDGRMTVESYQVFAVTPKNAHLYEATLFDDSEVEELACSMKATSHIGAEIGSKMTQVFTNYMTNHNLGYDLRDIPFSVKYEASLVLMDLEL